MGRPRRHWICKLQWFAKAPHQVPPLTFIQLWSCQITTLFQQRCINPTELRWCSFSLKTDYLQGCGATIILPVPTLPVRCSDIGRTAALLPAPVCNSQEAPAVCGHLVKSNLMRTRLCNTLLRSNLSSCTFVPSTQQEFVLSQPSKMFKHSRSRGIFHFEQGKCDWPLLQHTPHPWKTEIVSGLSPAPESRLTVA